MASSVRNDTINARFWIGVMSSPTSTTIKLQKLQRYVQLKCKQWQQQSSSVVEQSEINQQVQFICQYLYSINQENATFAADWFQQTIQQTPTYSSCQKIVYTKRHIANIFERLSQKIEPLVDSASRDACSHQTSDRTSKDNFKNAGIATQNVRIPQPIPFEKLSQKLQNQIRNRGGTKCSLAEAAKRYEKIPVSIREQGETAIEDYLKSHHWSHRISRKNGGSDSIWNGDWEQALPNQMRGGKNMTPKEILDVSVVRKVQQNFHYRTPVIIRNSAKAGGMAFLFEGGLSGVENLIAVQKNEKTIEQGIQDTLAQALEAGVISSIMVGGMSVIMITPVVGPAAISAVTASAPILTIVATASAAQRFVDILAKVPNLEGVNQIQWESRERRSSNMMEEFGLNLDETRLMFSLQYFLTLKDICNTRDRKNIKKQWLQSFQNATELFLSNQAQQQQQSNFDCHLITDTETLLNRVRQMNETPGSQLTKLLILLEVTLFVPYYPLQSSQDSQYKHLKLANSDLRNKYCQSLAKAMGLSPDCIQRFQDNYKKAMEGISGQWTNLLGGGLVGGLLLVVATAFFTPAIAALLAPILAPGLSGAAAVSAVLAALGGGAIAAGGFGMAGGFAVLVAGGAILGGGAGAGMGSLLARSPDAALTQAAKLEVVMKELVYVQKDIRKAQEIIKEQRQAIRSLEDKLDEFLVDKKNNKEEIENLKKAIKYLQEALKRNRDLL